MNVSSFIFSFEFDSLTFTRLYFLSSLFSMARIFRNVLRNHLFCFEETTKTYILNSLYHYVQLNEIIQFEK